MFFIKVNQFTTIYFQKLVRSNDVSLFEMFSLQEQLPALRPSVPARGGLQGALQSSL